MIKHNMLLSYLANYIVFVKPGVQEMSIFICAYKVSVEQYWEGKEND